MYPRSAVNLYQTAKKLDTSADLSKDMCMNIFELFFLAVGLSMDAFAVAICIGLAMQKVTTKKALTVGLYFGLFQAGMPLIGYFAASLFAGRITAFSHWIAFALLCVLGGNMILGSLKKEKSGDKLSPGEAKPEEKAASLKPAAMLPLAVATSIDALAVGASFAFLHVSVLPAVSVIGVMTLVISAVGVKLGSVFGKKFKSKAELAGGVILVLIGVSILLENLGVFGGS